MQLCEGLLKAQALHASANVPPRWNQPVRRGSHGADIVRPARQRRWDKWPGHCTTPASAWEVLMWASKFYVDSTLFVVFCDSVKKVLPFETETDAHDIFFLQAKCRSDFQKVHIA